ncbi:unnamed protein product [Microthlaspi erraticum]|uniref:Uncharacterized protein n=1 Tax=Microthlaspi erraticum TaxID=1685480 RepID=A0A6D2JKK6_9BRAS|nr:unnamed protein product [Microthlaspi erraticum]
MERMLNPLWSGLEPRWRIPQLRVIYHRATSAGFEAGGSESRFLEFAMRGRELSFPHSFLTFFYKVLNLKHQQNVVRWKKRVALNQVKGNFFIASRTRSDGSMICEEAKLCLVNESSGIDGNIMLNILKHATSNRQHQDLR